MGRGNVLNDPTNLSDIAERAHQCDDDKQYFADPNIKMMWRDGLGTFLIGLWKMVAKKKGYPFP